MTFKLHKIEWNTTQVKRFWDFQARQAAAQHTYFTYRWGAEIANLLAQATQLTNACVLDYGCGPGYMLKHLLAHGAKVAVADNSSESLKFVAERHGKDPNWLGTRTIGDSASSSDWEQRFDAVCCIETIEHAASEDLPKILKDIERYLKPGGIALFTTPNEEDLGAEMVGCPECGAVFHRWQHVRRWTASELQDALHEFGFDVLFCRGISFHGFQARRSASLFDLSVRSVYKRACEAIDSIMDRMRHRPFPNGRVFQRCLKNSYSYNLVAVARRP